MSDTPRTDEQINGKPCTRFAILDGDSLRDALVASEFARQLERELNAANSIIRQQQLLDEENLGLRQRIKRLEEAGDRITQAHCPFLFIEWTAAKESKP
jgi:hypothetical protein